ncbi:sulfate permease [Mesorhizobium sp. RMAD-H1]|uniref:SulP family inorganic anion transporter n=1 Tax=Mesorhizobium sp. RMAD-H1 TaxID=2587065 RepID=UPI00161591E0|nr:sulfate permease [Mesorhizobium sp. RMAD-H1]MBB2971505.1 SulP family sulfate permease [Mesorhizobium sp. RMAD-H1]
MATGSIRASFFELYTPKLVTLLREGYRLPDLKADVISGLTVAIVALPLSMAIAIASGVAPEQGLYTSIFGGFIVSALGGSRFQIGGPAGAFIVLVSATVAQHGVDGLLIATLLSGLILLAIGLLRLGTFIKFIPYPVTVGFTTGIAVIIFASQIRDLFGLTLEHEPGPLLPKLQALGKALPTASMPAVLVAITAIAIIVAIRRYRPHWPSFIIAVAVTAAATALVGLPVETIGTRFGGIPQSLPMPHLPPLSLAKVVDVLPNALSFALLGCIESLLSAVVADSMTGRRHRSNCELVAQGLANIVSPLFGGFCVTGNIARTAINVRSGARGPVSGMLHSVFLLLFMLVAAPLASYIPLAALAGVLAVVAWNMAEKHEFAALVRTSRGDAVVLLVTFLLVIFRDLTEGILVGFAISALLFLHRMAQAVEVENTCPFAEDDRADGVMDNRRPYETDLATDPDIAVFRISGAFFFGAAAAVGAALDRVGEHPKAYVIDFSAVPFLDSTGAATIQGFVRKARRQGAAIYIAGAARPVRRMLLVHGVKPPAVRFRTSLDDAIAAARDRTKSVEPAAKPLPV